MATLEELTVQVGINTDELTAGADGAADQVESSFGNMQMAAAGVAVGGLFMAGLNSAMDMQQTQANLQRDFGYTEAQAARAGQNASRLYAAGWGENMQEVGEAVGSVAQAMGGLGKVSDSELDKMSKYAMTLSQTLKVDVADAAGAAGNLIKNGLAKDGKEAFDVLTQAAQAVPVSMRADIPNVVEEYGKHFQRVGIDAKTAFGMMSQYVNAGGRDIDQAADVIHEFARITSEEAEVAEEAFKALGLPAKKMLEDVSKGGPKAEAALGKTLKALREMKDPAKQSALAVELFGDMAGEGADALWAMDPATAAAASGMDEAAGAADRAAKAQEATQALSAIWRTMTTTLGEMLLPALQKLAAFMAENPTLVKIMAGALLLIAAAIAIAVIAQWAWNTALWAFPGTWIIAAIIALIAIIVLIVVYWDQIVAATVAAWNWIVDAVLAGAGWVSNKISEFGAWISAKWGQIWGWVGRKTQSAVDAIMAAINWLRAIPGRVATWFGQVISFVTGLPSRISRATSGMWNGLLSSFKSAVNGIIRAWNGLSFRIGGGSIMGVSIPSITLSTPNIPYLADGGITTGPTLAMIGEGREQEAVLPLSKLDGMLQSVSGAVRRTGGDRPRDPVVRIELAGPESMKSLIRSIVQTDSRGGDVQGFFGT